MEHRVCVGSAHRQEVGLAVKSFVGKQGATACACVCHTCNKNDNQKSTSISTEDGRTRKKGMARDQEERGSNRPTKAEDLKRSRLRVPGLCCL